jgi:transcriptional regulator with XRE-family HTH domain
MIGHKIREYRLAKKLTVKKFAEIINISQGSLSDIENEKTKPSADTIVSITRNTDINPLWLLTDEGEMFNVNKESVEQFDLITKKIIILLKDLDEDKKRDILKYAEERKLLMELHDEREHRMRGIQTEMSNKGKEQKLIGQILLEAKVITKKQLEEGLKYQKMQGGRIGEHLLKKKYINETQLKRFLKIQRKSSINLPPNIP